MSQPSKPFIKSPPQTPPPAAAEARRAVSASELTTYAVAAGMHVPAERAAYLAHACAGNAGLREKIEQRLAARAPASVPEPSPEPPPEPTVTPPPSPSPGTELQRMPDTTLAVSQNHPAAMALVPMSAGQLAAITAQRSNTFPWMTATFLAVAVGALGVFLVQERDARQHAETAGKQAGQRAETAVQDAAAARSAVEKERETAAQQITAARQESEQLRTLADEQRQRAEAATQQAALAKAEADRQRLALENTARKEDDGAALNKAALVEAERERESIRAAQKETNLALADALARLATAQLEDSRFAEAETTARQSLDLRTAQAVTGWPLVESRALLGAALLQKNADAEAGRELAAAASAIEELGAPANDADRARLALASKRIVQFYNATGRRKEGIEWKRKFDALARAQ